MRDMIEENARLKIAVKALINAGELISLCAECQHFTEKANKPCFKVVNRDCRKCEKECECKACASGDISNFRPI